MGDEKSGSQSTAKLVIWLSFIAFLLIIAVFHSKISEITFGEKGVSAKMMNPQDAINLSSADRQNAEQALAQRVSSLEQQAKSQPQATPAAQLQAQNEPASSTQFSDPTYPQSVQPAISNVAGNWRAMDGSTYLITQVGTNVVLTGYANGYMLYIAGNGQIVGSHVNLQTMNLMYHSGTLSLDVSPNLRQLNGQYTDLLLNQSFPIQFYR